MSEIEDRRQRAREAAYDVKDFSPYVRPGGEAVEIAIEAATRVQITHEVIMAFIEAPDEPDSIVAPLAAAFRAAGFEVVE